MHFLYRENTHKFGIYNNPMNKNGGDVVDDEDELMKYSKLLEEDLESDTIEAVPGADSMNGT